MADAPYYCFPNFARCLLKKLQIIARESLGAFLLRNSLHIQSAFISAECGLKAKSDRTHPQTIACKLSRNPTEDSSIPQIDTVHIAIGAFFHIDYIG